jgi:plasmid stabilization system protein ParE
VNRSYYLTPGAVEEIRDIGDWSMERWGKEITLKYLAELHSGLEFIATNFETLKSNKTLKDLSGGTGLMI